MIKQIDLDRDSSILNPIFMKISNHIELSSKKSLYQFVKRNIHDPIFNSCWISVLFSIEADIQKKVTK